MQLRTLMMDELPAIIHRLSLRLWCPELGAQEDEEQAQAKKTEETPVDPFSSPPQDAVDSRGNVLDANDISTLSLDGGSEIHSLFSQKNLLRLAALTDSHRTLSLFTPSIRDAVFRAWAGPSERSDSTGSSTPAPPNLMRSNSSLGSTGTTYTFTNRGSDDGHGHMPSRPSLVSMQSATTGLSLGAGRHSRSNLRKKKNRVVNLRRSKTTDDIHSESGDSETASVTASEPFFSAPVIEEPEDNIITPPHSPSQRVRFRTSSIDLGDSPRKSRLSTPARPAITLSSRTVPEQAIELTPIADRLQSSAPIVSRQHRPSFNRSEHTTYPVEKLNSHAMTNASVPLNYTPAPIIPDPAPGIVEQAWVLKMAGEIARRTHNEKASREGFWAPSSGDEREETPPPAYEAKAII